MMFGVGGPMKNATSQIATTQRALNEDYCRAVYVEKP